MIERPEGTSRDPADRATSAGGEYRGTVRLAGLIGADGLEGSDPTEDYHVASRIDPGIVDPFVVGAARLERSLPMRLSATRSVKRHSHLPFVQLPPAALGAALLGDALRTRRSRRDYGRGPLTKSALATLLQSAYGVTGSIPGTPQELRSAPSGGALFPLELYVAAQHVEGLDRALYHYDPLRHGLERMRGLAPDEARDLTPYRELLQLSAAFVVVTAMFWRARFKYGARAYRFALLEAGHLAQSFLLAVEALSLAATPVGGFFDTRVDEFVGLDGIFEAALYLLPVGRRS